MRPGAYTAQRTWLKTLSLRVIRSGGLALTVLALSACDANLDCDAMGTRHRVRENYSLQAFSLLRGSVSSPVELSRVRGEASFKALVRHTQDHLGADTLLLRETATLSRDGRFGPARCTGLIEAEWPPSVVRLFAEHPGWEPGVAPVITGNRVRHRVVYATRHGRRGTLRVELEADTLNAIRDALGSHDPFSEAPPGPVSPGQREARPTHE